LVKCLEKNWLHRLDVKAVCLRVFSLFSFPSPENKGFLYGWIPVNKTPHSNAIIIIDRKHHKVKLNSDKKRGFLSISVEIRVFSRSQHSEGQDIGAIPLFHQPSLAGKMYTL